MGSEFSYEDLNSLETEKYTYHYIESSPCPTDNDSDIKGACHVIETYPKSKYSGYTKMVHWLDVTELRPVMVHYFDKKKSHFKTLKFYDYTLFLDKHWRASRLFMENHQTKKSTILKFEGIKFKTGLAEKDFTKQSLRRTK